MGLFAVRDVILPDAFETTTREAVRGVLQGLSFAAIGALCWWWHLREARRREERPHADVFWGRSLYFHLVAALALGFLLTGLPLLLTGVVEAALPDCAHVIGPIGPGECVREGRESSVRQIVDAGIILAVSAPVWFWHLRRGRQVTTGE